MTKPAKSNPTWSDLKTNLSNFDQIGMMALVQDMYALSKENQAFLHARFGLGADPLKPYKETILRWLRPDFLKYQNTSVSKAKKAISDYKKAIGREEDLADLMTYYCEQAIGFAIETYPDEHSYFDSLVKMYSQALILSIKLTLIQRTELMKRLEIVREKSFELGNGVWDELTFLIDGYQINN
jgi:hypothetical protein